MTTVQIEELEAHLRDVLAHVQAGETVLIAENGATVAQLSPSAPMSPLSEAFPGMRRPSKRMRDIHIERVSLSDGTDILDVLREVRGP